jgi:broad specificity phosphatase PhoE
MTVTTVLLARHGQTDSNIKGFYMGWSNEGLNEAGLAQARELAHRLAAVQIDAIYTSPLKRAYTTATIAAEAHKLEVNVINDLIEVKLGVWEGLHIDEIARGWPELWREWRSDPTHVVIPQGESFKQVYERAVHTLTSLVSANKGKQILIVTHEIIVKIAAIYALGAPTSIYRRFDLSNASLTRVNVTEGKARLIMLNDTSHLEF